MRNDERRHIVLRKEEEEEEEKEEDEEEEEEEEGIRRPLWSKRKKDTDKIAISSFTFPRARE